MHECIYELFKESLLCILCIYADSAALYTSWSACSCSLRLPVCLPVTDLCLHGTSGTRNNYEDHWVTGAVELHIWVILSAVYHSVVWLRSNTRWRNLFSSVCVILIFRQLYTFPRILCTYHVRNIYTVGLGGVITSMVHVKYGPLGHLNHARRGGSQGLLILVY